MAPEYELAPDAEDDLVEIARYTIATWGLRQAAIYENALVRCFAAIASGDDIAVQPIRRRPEIFMTRCEHHFVFYCRRANAPPLILGVLHERMERLSRMRKRL